jgi:PAS domain S-box-containing protein
MRLTLKVFLGVLVSVVSVAYAATYLASRHQVAALEERIVEENRVVAALLGRQIEVAQLTLNWPFAGLEAVTKHRDFLFWWVVADGRIRLANDAAFMGTTPPRSLPSVDLSAPQPQVVVDRARRYGVVIHPVNTPGQTMTFWLGFSLESARQSRARVLLSTTAVALGALVLVSIAVYLTVRRFLGPLRELKRGAEIIGGGDLSHRMQKRSRDEIGELVDSFNDMAQSLARTTVSKDYVKAIVAELAEALIVFGTDGRIVTVNRAAGELLGCDEAELVGGSIDGVFPEHDDAMRPANVLANGGLRNHETTCRRRDGSTVPVLFGATLFEQPGDRVYVVCTGSDISERKLAEGIREGLITELRESMAKIKTLRGLIPICASCKKVRDDSGYWNQVEVFVRDRTEAEFSHGICPDCAVRLYPGHKPKG